MSKFKGYIVGGKLVVFLHILSLGILLIVHALIKIETIVWIILTGLGILLLMYSVGQFIRYYFLKYSRSEIVNRDGYLVDKIKAKFDAWGLCKVFLTFLLYMDMHILQIVLLEYLGILCPGFSKAIDIALDFVPHIIALICATHLLLELMRFAIAQKNGHMLIQESQYFYYFYFF